MSTIQFCLGGHDIGANGMDRADCVRLWLAGDCVVSLTRKGDGWKYDGSDFGHAFSQEALDQNYSTWEEGIWTFATELGIFRRSASGRRI